MEEFEKIIKKNKDYEFELQKFFDITSNIKDYNLQTRINAQMIKCQIKILEIIKIE